MEEVAAPLVAVGSAEVQASDDGVELRPTRAGAADVTIDADSANIDLWLGPRGFDMFLVTSDTEWSTLRDLVEAVMDGRYTERVVNKGNRAVLTMVFDLADGPYTITHYGRAGVYGEPGERRYAAYGVQPTPGG